MSSERRRRCRGGSRSTPNNASRCAESGTAQAPPRTSMFTSSVPSMRHRSTMRPVSRFAWLGVSGAVACSLASQHAEAFVQPTGGGGWGSRSRGAHAQSARQATYMMSERRGLWPQRPVIDLRSDTVTLPTGAMRKAMHKAEVGDDVLGEDPTVKKLEAETAEMLEKEAALFVPSGTMANLICHLVWCSQRGSEMILGDQSHSFLWEQANAAQFGGIGYRPLPNLADGTMDLQAIEAAVRGNNPCFPVSRLVSVENTHAQRGGKVLPLEYLDDLGNLAQEEGLRVHMDGARLWNAAAALKVPLSRIVAGVDSVSVCYSKGLGAPVGSAVVGSQDFISRATRVRKALGGGMRQSGVVAAAALEGLRKQYPRISDDHTHAKRLAQGFYDLGMPDAVDVDPASVQTNIVMVSVGPNLTDEGMTAPVVCDRLREKGVLAMALMPGVIRFVTHSQVSATEIQRTVAMMKEVLEEAGLRPLGVPRPAPAPAVEESAATDPLDIHAEAEATSKEMSGQGINPNSTSENASQGKDGDASQTSPAAVKSSADASDKSGASEKSEATGMPGSDTVNAPGLNGSAGSGVGSGVDVDGADGSASVGERSLNDEGDEEGEEEEASPFLEEFEEVELKGMAVSNEGFVAVMTSKESSRGLKLVITPDDPMSGGLDVQQAETPEARTLLQLMQGIDVARHLPTDALGTLMDLSMSSGVQLSTVYVSCAKPFCATLMAKVPHRDSETGYPAPISTDQAAVATAAAAAAGGGCSSVDDEWVDGGAAAAAAAAATAAELASDGTGEMKKESPVSPSVPGTTMGSGFGRPRLGVSKIAETKNSFDALGLALRYPASRIFVRADVLAAGSGDRAATSGAGGSSSFDAADLLELYPNLMKLEDAKTRRSAADDMDAQLEVQKLRQQLESAMNAGDSDRISLLREELNSLVVTDPDTAPVS